MSRISAFNEQVVAARSAAEEAMQPLARAYEKAIRRLGVEARAGLLHHGRLHIVAAGQQEQGTEWHEPDLDELFTTAEGAAILEAGTRAARAAMVAGATGPWVDELDTAVRDRITGEIARLLAQRITEVSDSVRHEAGLIIRHSLDDGLSIDNAAAALRQGINAFSVGRSLLIARTEMVGAANAASYSVARTTGVASGKVWLATEDDRTRPDHADADGQEVGLLDAFNVGGYEMMYPGDESAPPDEVCNCRCTITYTTSDEAGGGAPGGGEEADVEGLTAAASGATGLPLSERDRAWDAGAAKARVKEWATSGGNLDLDKAARAFFWRPGGSDEQWSGLKLPFADVINGTLTAVWGGVHGAAAAIQGARGGVDIPEADVPGVKDRIGGYYDKAEKQYNDPSIEPPWETPSEEKAEGSASALRAAAVEALPSRITMAGLLQFVTSPTDDGQATRFRSLLAPLETPTSDGRILSPVEAGAIGWRELPLTLMAMFQTADGHDGAHVAGRIDTINVEAAEAGEWAGQAFVGEGVFDDGPEAPEDAPGRQAARLARDGTLTGVSVDIAPEEWELRTRDNEPISEDDDEAWLEALFGGGLMAITRGEIMGATICPFPAFTQASVTVVASLAHAEAVQRWAQGGAATPQPTPAPIPEVVEQAVEEPAAGALTMERLTVVAAAISLGLMTLNEGRVQLAPGLEPVTGGDALGELLPRRESREEPLVAALEQAAELIGDRTEVLAAVRASGAALEAVRADVADTLGRVVEAATPKPRTLRIERDDDGRMTRAVEEAV